MEMVVDLISLALIVVGGAFLLISGTGLLRMPDVFTRMHAAGIADTLGADLVLTGLILQAGFTLNAVKLILVLLFLLVASPVSSHAVARAALQGGIKPVLADDPER